MSQQDTKDFARNFYRASATDFIKIPGSPVAYWASKKVFSIFGGAKRISQISSLHRGISTGNTERFSRQWYEVSNSRLCLRANNRETAKHSKACWFPYNRGGIFRKWYGLGVDVLDYEDDGRRMVSAAERGESPGFRHDGAAEYFRPTITWTALTAGKPSFRLLPPGYVLGHKGSSIRTADNNRLFLLALLNSKALEYFLEHISPTLDINISQISSLPMPGLIDEGRVSQLAQSLVEVSKGDWDSFETSWDFEELHLLALDRTEGSLAAKYGKLRAHWNEMVIKMQRLEVSLNRLFIKTYALEDELDAHVPLEEVTLDCNPHYRYGGKRREEEYETLLQCDTIRELASFALGCMMGRYSLDKPGLILAGQGEVLPDYLRHIPSPLFSPDDDAILPLTDQEWFSDDATNRFREFVRVVWGDEHLQENLDFVAESLCLHAIKPKRGESALDTIRRYLSTQFYKDHLRTYKKRPIYWLFSSGKHKAFECLVYLHRYNEGTLARMRTEYVIPLSAKLNVYSEKLEQDKEASTSAAETKRLEKEIATLHKQQAELAEFDEKLRHYADQRISLDLDDGVKVNYGKFGDLLAEVKAVTGEKPQ